MITGEEEALNVNNKDPHFITAGSKGTAEYLNIQ